MANTLGTQMTLLAAGTPPDPGFVDGSIRVFAETVTYAAQAVSDTIEVGRLPKGAILLYGVLTTSVSTATATLAVGVSGTAGKYKAAAALTATDTPTPFGVATALSKALTAQETIIVTVGTAALPASGTLQVTLVYAFN